MKIRAFKKKNYTSGSGLGLTICSKLIELLGNFSNNSGNNASNSNSNRNYLGRNN
jgi:hypothetical protein